MDSTAPTPQRAVTNWSARVRPGVAAVLLIASITTAIGGGMSSVTLAVDTDPATPTPNTPVPAPAIPPATTATTVPAAPTTQPPEAPPVTTPPAAAPTTTTAPPAPAPAPAPAPRNVQVIPSQIAHILATIRYLESRGNYNAPPNRGNASGAYQFIASTWNGFGGYAHAYLAPPEVQDERAALDVTRFLAQWNNDVSMIPVMWYYPKAARETALMDVVPVPSAGNILTVREYQQRWLAIWAFTSGQPVPQQLTLADALARLGVPPTVPAVAVDPSAPAIERLATVAFPALGPARVATPECGDPAENVDAGATPEEIAGGLCAEEAPGIVFGVQLQPVLSVVDGVITDVDDVLGATIAVTVTDVNGRSYRLAGFNDDNPGTDDGAAPAHLRLAPLTRVGASVRAGQLLGFMGNSSALPLGVRADVPTDATVNIALDAVAPHVRLTIEDLDGVPVDAYGPVIDALFRQACSVGTGPWSGPAAAEPQAPVTIETTDNDRNIDSQWVITDRGQVQATGWAAMIYPGEGCAYAPGEARGPGAGGTTAVPESWWAPIDLPTSTWIELARRQDDRLLSGPFLRP